MKSTGWIAVAGWLIAWPVFAQFSELPPSPTSSEAALPDSDAPQESGTASFDLELERLRRELTATKTLREQVATETSQPAASDAPAQELRRELLELLTKLATKKSSPKPVSDVPIPHKSGHPSASKTGSLKAEAKSDFAAVHPRISDKIVDPFALGRALFRAGDFREAEQAFRKVKVTDENVVYLQYLVATCLRKQSLWDDATKAYRIVAENKDDPALRDLALWQLDNIRWYQQTDSQLEQLQKLRESAGPSASR